MLKLGLRNVVGSRPPAIAPSVPTDVVITVVSDTEFSIAYVSAFPVEFWYSTTEEGEYTKHGDSASTPYAMTGLTQGTLYYVKPRSVNGSKYSAFGSAVSAYTYPDLTKFLFLGLYSEIADGKMPNKLGEDYLTIAGSSGSETYTIPDTATYKTADEDYIWNTSYAQVRNATTAELIGYDFSRTLVWYGDTSPNSIAAIAILKSGETLTESESNAIRTIFHLSIWWDGTLSEYGNLKDNRGTERSIYTGWKVADIDGNLYTPILIGTQVWLLENLKVTKYNDSSDIPNLTVDANWAAEDGSEGHDGAYRWYANNVANKDIYGGLYNYYAVINAKGLAPAGYHVPSQVEINTLVAYLDNDLDVIGGKLKENGTDHWNSPNPSDNSTGFTLLGSGRIPITGGAAYIKQYGWIWTNTNYDATQAYAFRAAYDSVILTRPWENKKYGYSVRCIKD